MGHPRMPFLSESSRRSALFLDHTLRRNDVRICLELLHREMPGFQLLFWKQAPEDVRASAEVPVAGRRTARVPIVPDGVFAVRHHGQFHLLFLETDMGTVPVKRMQLRYQAYWRWWKDVDPQSHGTQKAASLVPPVQSIFTPLPRITGTQGVSQTCPGTQFSRENGVRKTKKSRALSAPGTSEWYSQGDTDPAMAKALPFLKKLASR